MEKYNINTKNFEGPLDLLLYLINENEVDIYDIPIVDITNQYMDYIYARQSMDLKVATEFIIMASQLLEIKSKMLLPSKDEVEEQEEDPRQELARKIYEYKIFKEISIYLAQGQEKYFHTFTKEPMYLKAIMVEPENIDLDIEILSKIMKKYIAESKLLDEKLKNYEKLQKDKVTVYEKMFEIKNEFLHKKTLSFSNLLKKQKNIHHTITLFLAMLEMKKQNIIDFKQEQNFTDIMLILNMGEQLG